MFCKLLLALALVVGCGGSGAPAETPVTSTEPEPESESDETPEELVRVYLLSDVTAIGPGQEFRLAARFDIEPSWHIYWINPGEAGLPTKATFEAPASFEIGEVSYPGPLSFDGGGGITNYGYHELVMLSAPVTAPEKVSGSVAFKVNASWLACREICVPGQTVATMSLPVATEQTPATAGNTAMFESHDRTLPNAPGEAGVEYTWQEERRALELTVGGAERAEYFPTVAEQASLSGQLSVRSDDGVTLVLSFNKAAHPVARGVLGITKNGARRYHHLTWEHPQ